jgi:thymidine kinase
MRTGIMKVYTGPMYSSKTTSLIGELTIALDNNKRALVIKPIIDKRYAMDDIVSHDGVSIKNLADVDVLLLDVSEYPSKQQLSNVDIVLIDEAQFFVNIGEHIDCILNMGIDIVAVGLDMDSNGKPFGSMPLLLSKANKVYKLTATCSVCDMPATRTYRKPGNVKDQVLIGGTDIYEPRCLTHWQD